MTKFRAIASALLLFVMSASAFGQDGQCLSEYNDWNSAFNKLGFAVSALNELKEAPITNRVTRVLGQAKGSVSTASVIRSILRERNRSIQEASNRVSELMEIEKSAFDGIRKCLQGDKRKSDSHPLLASVSKSRSKMLSDVQDSLIQEAYVQYKKEQPNPTVYSQYDNQRPQMGYNRGYSPANPYGYMYGYQ
jgi:hypothetical protein